MQAPYSLEEAEVLCQEFQCLIGKAFEAGKELIIKDLVVAPYSQTSKMRFLMCYVLFDDPRTALEYDYAGSRYEVLVLAGTPGQEDMFHEPLDIWLGKNMYTLAEDSASSDSLSSSPAARHSFCSFYDSNDTNKS